MKTEKSVFSRNLIKYRKAQGLSQAKLAELTGVSRRMIVHYETNVVNPAIKTATALANALKISVNDLMSTNTEQTFNLYEDIDPRTLKKIMLIKKLPKKDRMTIYGIIDSMIEKNKIKITD